MGEITRASIGFRDHDLANITKIMEYVDVGDSKANAVSLALSFAELLLREMADGNDVKVHNGESVDRINVTSLKRKRWRIDAA